MRRSRTVSVCLATSLASICGLAACNSDGRTLRPANDSQTQSVYTPTTTTIPATGNTLGADIIPATQAPALQFVLHLPFSDGGAIDPAFTCTGADVHPEISWFGAPTTAVEMALVVTDTDADDFVHWIIAGLDPFNPLIGEGDVPIGAIEGQNGFSTAAAPAIGWRGPCPPAGTVHHYRFTLYALGQQVELPTGSAAADLRTAIEATAIAAAQVTGVYSAP